MPCNYTVELLNGSDSQASEYLVSQCVTERDLIVVSSRKKGTQTKKESSDGIIGELIEVRLGKGEQRSFCPH